MYLKNLSRAILNTVMYVTAYFYKCSMYVLEEKVHSWQGVAFSVYLLLRKKHVWVIYSNNLVCACVWGVILRQREQQGWRSWAGMSLLCSRNRERMNWAQWARKEVVVLRLWGVISGQSGWGLWSHGVDFRQHSRFLTVYQVAHWALCVCLMSGINQIHFIQRREHFEIKRAQEVLFSPVFSFCK